jgi:hypothetical protein
MQSSTIIIVAALALAFLMFRANSESWHPNMRQYRKARRGENPKYRYTTAEWQKAHPMS